MATRVPRAHRVGGASVVGIAKGVGVLEPDMATMLAYVVTDAEVDPARLDRLWRDAVEATLNCLSVDTDTSTSDTDPSWGRVAMAVGKCGDDTDIDPDPDPDPDRVTIAFGDLALHPSVEGQAPALERLREILSADEVTISVDLGVSDTAGPHRATVYGCDLSDGYVRINADYTT